MLELNSMDGKKFQVTMVQHDPVIEGLATKIGDQLSRSEDAAYIDYENYFFAPNLTIALSPRDIFNGSFQFNNKARREKVVFYKSPQQELLRSEQLRAKGVKGVISYTGSLSFQDGDNYNFANLPASAINLGLVRLCDRKETPYFGTFDILAKIAEILSQIHRQGMVQGNFAVPSFIFSSEPNDEHPIVLFRNDGSHESIDDEERMADVESLINSLTDSSPDCSHETQRSYFLERYKELVK